MITCDRCHKDTNCWTMSRFNTDKICMECKKREKAHPAYPAAAERERQEVLRGNLNFPGVGAPSELYDPEPQTAEAGQSLQQPADLP